MQKVTEETRLNQIPVIHVYGTHYVIGYTIGRQCKSLIDSVLTKWKFYNDVIIEKFLTPEGKQIYDASLALCTQKFSSYVDELKGMADGAGVPFYKLFLLHIDSLIVPPELEDEYGKQHSQTGCTTVMCNSDEVLQLSILPNNALILRLTVNFFVELQVIIGHTEDACPEFLNNVFLVSAHIVNNEGTTLEKFTTLTYAGYLPGYTMGYNHHGMIYTVNTIFPKMTLPNRTPRNFLARAILRASNLHQVVDILRDAGNGASDGFSVNLHFTKQEGTPVLHNVEVGPNKDLADESELSMLTLTHGEHHAHCNKYLRLKIEELCGVGMESSTHRHKTIGRHLIPTSMEEVKVILSDQSDNEYPIFRCGKKQDYVKTVAVGIFNVTNRKWYIYMEPPASSAPVATIPLDM
ncbi:unnamed protein product [Orchesella dallaii]|uniref:Peptidase C45 hydrolase domain-containing protein n=1 Tax=Orchesella dallaii TaxID=48710 RepID=A0ABP1RTP4_9HEXA